MEYKQMNTRIYFFNMGAPIILIFMLFIVLCKELSAQDINFSQKIASPQVLSPAMAGAEYNFNVSSVYRTQWSSISLPFRTVGLSIDFRYRLKESKNHFGVAFSAYNDKAGEVSYKTTNLGISLAYHIRINKQSTFGLGLMGAYVQGSLDVTNAQYGSQYDGLGFNSGLSSNENFLNKSLHFFNSGAGLVYHLKKNEQYMTGNDQLQLTTGLAIYNTLKPDIGLSLNTQNLIYHRYTAFARCLVGLPNTNLSLMPALYFQYQQTAYEVLVGSYVHYQIQGASKYTGLKEAFAISPGLFYRYNDAMVFKLMLEKQSYALGFAYDWNVSSLRMASNGFGGFEMFLRFVTPNPFGSDSSARFN